MRSSGMRACRPASSLVEHVAFDEDEGILTITLAGKRRYAYFEVPQALYRQLCQAPSPGRFYNEQIKQRFACREVGARRRFRPA